MSRQPFGLRFATALTFPALCLRTLRQGRRRKPKTSRRPKAADEIVKIYLTGEGLLMEAVTMLRLRQGSGSPILGSFSVAVAQADQDPQRTRASDPPTC